MLNSSNERTDLISDAIRSQAEQQAKEIITKANAFRTGEIEKCKEELNIQGIAEYRDTLNTAQQNAVLAVSHAEQESLLELLRHRQELEERIFSAVRERLIQYASTEAYRQGIISLLETQKPLYRHTATVISLRPADMVLAERISAMLPGCTIQEDRKNRLGGFTLENTEARIFIDEMLESRLALQREWYLEECHLKVN